MKKLFSLVLFLSIPITAFAAQDLDSLIEYSFVVVSYFGRVLVPLGILFFFYNLIKFIYESREGKADLGKHKDMMIWSGVAIFMMVGLWSVVAWIQSSFGEGALNSDITEGPPLPYSTQL